MINRALKAQKEEVKRAESEFNNNLFKSIRENGWVVGEVDPKVVEYQGVEYDVVPRWMTVVDEYDEYTGTVELSHKHSLGYAIVTSYKGDPDTLDFRFMRAQDSVKLTPTDSVKKVFLNSTNIRYACFEGKNDLDFDITIDSDLEDFVLSLRVFLRNNVNSIRKINFQNITSRFVLKYAKRMCEWYCVDKIAFIQEEEIEENTNGDKPVQYKKKRNKKD